MADVDAERHAVGSIERDDRALDLHLRPALVEPRGEVPPLSTGDSVRHGTLGEGVVIRVEPGGVVTVRFADDGAERRLMLEYAPLDKIA